MTKTKNIYFYWVIASIFLTGSCKKVESDPTPDVLIAKPSDLVAVTKSSSIIDLSWKDNATNEEGYIIERSLDGDNFSEIASISSSTTNFSDTTLNQNTTYYYKIKAFNANKISDYSNITSETTYPTIFTVATYDGIATASFGDDLPYRIFYPLEFKGQTHIIHVSRGGNGFGDDRSQLLPYVERYVQKGYVVIQIDHRFAGTDINLIAQYRGEEIKFISEEIASNKILYGDFKGSIDVQKQGFIGHSGGCMEGLEAAGVSMSHGNYFAQNIKAIYGMSPAGNDPDQFGINANGFEGIDKTNIFLVLGEEEKDVNGAGDFMTTDWRLQSYAKMNSNS
ncbi:MAG: fibronectin type III domain-containing protein, partial [Thermonemataceae bacterium]|nr:fibronectin type III domain-containing protein [Thermonemataceae bacterium]